MLIDEPITVGMVDNTPKYLIWKGRNYTINKVGLHHIYRTGRSIYHIFSVLTGAIFLRLKLNAENLSWRLEEVSDAI